MVIESAGLTHAGMKREGNEDALLLDDRLGLYVVADGMGGHLAGEVASRLTANSLHDNIERLLNGACKIDPGELDETLSHEANVLAWGINRANHEVHQLSKTDESCHGMGSTISAIYIAGSSDRLVTANVGDSPVWLIHDGRIETLSVSHTVMADQTGFECEPSVSSVARYKHVLTRAVGVGENVKPDICEVQCFKGDVLVMCSDGLSNKVSPVEVLDVVTRQSPTNACHELVNLANDRGGEDNITVAIIRLIEVSRNGSLIKRALAWFGLRLGIY